jgi:hypothetical protein
VPRSLFLGRVPAPGEPLWTDDDRDWAMALLAYEADLCECGQPRSESMSADSEFAYRTEPMRCHACQSIAKAAEPFAESGTGQGLFINVIKTRGAHG